MPQDCSEGARSHPQSAYFGRVLSRVKKEVALSPYLFNGECGWQCEPCPDQRLSPRRSTPGNKSFFQLALELEDKGGSPGTFPNTLVWSHSPQDWRSVAITRKFQQRALFPNNPKWDSRSRKRGEPRSLFKTGLLFLFNIPRSLQRTYRKDTVRLLRAYQSHRFLGCSFKSIR